MGKIRRLTIYSNKIKKSKKILIYSDLHLGFKDRSNIKKIFEIPQLSPELYDYILIPGDIVHIGKCLESNSTKKHIISDLSRLTGDTKTYISLGNHDQYERIGFENWSSYCSSAAISTFSILPNIELLDINKKVVTEDLEFSAINNSVYYYLEKHESKEFFFQEYNIRNNKMSFSKEYFSILLCHDPKSLYHISKEAGSCLVPNTDLVVSGHMHNGFTPNFLQDKLNGYGFLSPDYTLFPDIAYGIRDIADTLFLVNGAVSSFVEVPLINKIFGLNCTILNLEPQEEGKKLVYTYK